MVSQGDIEAIICKKFGTHCANAIQVARCESGLVLTKINTNDSKVTGYNSYGLFQINGPSNWAWHDAQANTDAAYDKFIRRGWQPWTTCRKKLGLA